MYACVLFSIHAAKSDVLCVSVRCQIKMWLFFRISDLAGVLSDLAGVLTFFISLLRLSSAQGID